MNQNTHIALAVLLNARMTAWSADPRYGRWLSFEHTFAWQPGQVKPAKRLA